MVTLPLFAAVILAGTVRAFSIPPGFPPHAPTSSVAATALRAAADDAPPPPSDADEDAVAVNGDAGRGSAPPSSAAASSTARVGINSRGAKMNEIDFTLAPADVSLSTYYGDGGGSDGDGSGAGAPATTASSLARALNAASNRAVRRILLSRSWPSAAALNRSMRAVLARQRREEERATAAAAARPGAGGKCPVPRPILNLMTGKGKGRGGSGSAAADPGGADDPAAGDLSPAEREERWIRNQLADFSDSYGAVPGYDQAEAYLECLFSLSTSGVESGRAAEVREGGLYAAPYARVLSVIQSAGAVLEAAPEGGPSTKRRIATKLIDQDFCLSMVDKISLANERKNGARVGSVEKIDAIAGVSDGDGEDAPTPPAEPAAADRGGVLLSADAPTATRQLNALSNIVRRTLLYGGDQELLVLAETLAADRPAFVRRWHPAAAGRPAAEPPPSLRYLDALVLLLRTCYARGVLTAAPPFPAEAAGATGYRNAYGRLAAALIEGGSGYVRPATGGRPGLSLAMTTTAATARYLTSTAPPRSAREELGRFAKWETAVRKNRENPYPEDLVGTWNVQDVVGTQTVGTTEVSFRPRGELAVRPPMQGLRWRLDPGPTHLDTCTFQVLSEDGAILQYRGFVDRGSRLEARLSGRSVSMRGGVSFLMRDADDMAGDGASDSDDYWDDMVPMNYKSGTTRFVMSRNVAKK